MRALLEKRVHDFISADNDKSIEASLARLLKKLHAGKDCGPEEWPNRPARLPGPGPSIPQRAFVFGDMAAPGYNADPDVSQ